MPAANSIAARAGRLPHATSTSLFDPLEPRVLLTTFFYQELAPTFVSPAPIAVLRPTGDDATTTLGSSVASIGDLDGDDTPDFIVGAGGDEATDVDGSGQGGAEAVVYSGATLTELFRFEDGFSEFGAAVTGLDDITGDNIPDFAIGSPRHGATTPNDVDGTGRVYIYNGADGTLLHTLDGEMPGDRFGAALADAGDIDGDGAADLAVGAPGADGARGSVYIYSGDGSIIRRVDGQTVNSRFGFDIAALGDMDGDNFGEILVGAPGRTESQLAIPGQAYVISGADGEIAATFTGAHDGDLFGHAVASAGDVDGDSLVDFAVGAPYHNVELPDGTIVTRAGTVRIYAGEDMSLIHMINGGRDNAHFGAALELAGDVNQDNSPDILVGAPGAGDVALISGETALPLTTYTAEARQLAGADRIGGSIANLGDITGDNVTDFLFASTQATSLEAEDDRNRFYVFSGVEALSLTPQGINNDNDVWGTAETGAFLILDNEFFLLEGRPGLAGSDRIVDVNANGQVIGLSSGGQSFLWQDDVRTPVMDLVNETEGPAAVYTTFRAVDITDSGDILIERRRDDGALTTWVLDDGTLRHRFDGIPVAMNESGAVVGLDNNPAGATSILWTPDNGATTIQNFTAEDINDNNDLVGTAVDAGGGSFAALRTNDGAIVNLGTLPNGMNFRPIAVNDDRLVIGEHITTGGQDGAWVWQQGEGMQDIRTATTIGATDDFSTSADFNVLNVTETGAVVGSLNDVNTGFTLTPFNTAGPFTGAGDVTLSRDSDGDLVATTRNPADEIIAFRRPDDASTWVADDLRTEQGVPTGLTDSVTYHDPRTGENHVAVGTADGLLVLRRDENGDWQTRNLTQELASSIGGAELITDNLITFTNVDGTVYLAGQADDGDLLVYHQTGRLQNGQAEWTFINLYEDQLAPAGHALPDFEGPLSGYVTPWGGLNIAGLDENGEIIVVWTSPELNMQWESTNLTEGTGAPILAGGFTSFVTPWGGINLVGLNEDGDVTSTWWVPGFGGTWLTNNLTQEFNGARLRSDTITSYVTDWGGLNIAGIDENDDVVVYWWVPGFDSWRITPIVSDFNDAPGRPVGRLQGETTGDRIHLTGTARDGDVIRIHWQPDQWQVENLTDQAIANA